MATDRFNGVVASKAIKVRCVLGAEANVAVLEDVQTIESIAVVAGDRVLLTAQTDPIENGVWDVVSGGPWTRAADWDGNRDIEKGSTVWAGSFGQDDKLWQVQTELRALLRWLMSRASATTRSTTASSSVALTLS